LAVLAFLPVAGAGCALPIAAWPEWPAGAGREVAVTDPDGAAIADGYVLLRVYEYFSGGVAEGARTVRNQHALDAAFGYRRPVPVNVRPGIGTRYRLVRVDAVPLGDGGTAALPGFTEVGSLWLCPPGKGARGGVHACTHFAEVQAFVAGRPPSPRVEVGEGTIEVRVAAADDAVRWRHDLGFALEDLRARRPEAFTVREFLEAELAALEGRHPEAFVPDGVSVPEGTAAEAAP
jgi:hypothetical protein